MYTYYTDGAASRNGAEDAEGGWAYICVNDEKVLYGLDGYIAHATNNICELMAVNRALNDAILNGHDGAIIYTDSAYIANCFKDKWYIKWMNNGWITSNNTPVKNKELWESIISKIESGNYQIEKIKGHNGNIYNDMVDAMAVKARVNGASSS